MQVHHTSPSQRAWHWPATAVLASMLAMPAQAQETPPRYTGGIIVKWRDDVAGTRQLSVREQSDRLQQIGQRAGATLQVRRAMSGQAELLQGATTASVETVAAKIAQDPRVAYAVPDRWVQRRATPNDPWFSQQTNLQIPATVTGGANLPPAWDITTGLADVVIAVVDSGYTDHPDLADAIVPGYDFISNAFVANDGDGRDADARDTGNGLTQADLQTADAQAAGCSASAVGESSWHGTMVAGVAAARANDSYGIAGVNWNARIQPVRVIGRCGGLLSDIIDGMRWAGGLSVPGVPDNPTPARVVNVSVGPTARCSAAEQDAVSALTDAGIAVVVAAGNNGFDNFVESPADCAGAIGVAAHTDSGEISDFSSLGAEIALSAPGGGCPRSLMGTDGTCTTSDSWVLTDSNTGTYSASTPGLVRTMGTSFSAPTVAGVAALMLAVQPSLTPAQIRAGLQQSARSHPAGTYCANNPGVCGAGLLDAAGAVAYAQTVVQDTGSDATADTTDTSTTAGTSAGTSESGGGGAIPLAGALVLLAGGVVAGRRKAGSQRLSKRANHLRGDLKE